jgi:hypothetical protein
MRAYKFLDAAGRAPFTLTPWTVGVWVETASAMPCRQGVHACRPADLSYWLAPYLWEVELEEPVVETRHKLTARRGRLLAQVDAYPAAAEKLGRCAPGGPETGRYKPCIMPAPIVWRLALWRPPP